MLLETIKELIKERNLRLNAIAQEIDVSPVTLTRNFKGDSEMKIGTLEAIIQLIGERDVYARIMDNLQTLEWVMMDNQDDSIWGVFLVNNKPSFAGLLEGKRVTIYVHELDITVYNRKKIESCFSNGVEIDDFKEDTNIVNMWVYQYERKNFQR